MKQQQMGSIKNKWEIGQPKFGDELIDPIFGEVDWHKRFTFMELKRLTSNMRRLTGETG